MEATISALTDLQHSLTLQQGGGRGGVQRVKSEASAGTEAGIGATAGVEIGGADAGNRANADVGTKGSTGIEDEVHNGS